MTTHEPIQATETGRPYRLTQRDYTLLAEHGTFDRFAKVELIEGAVIAVNAQYSRHGRVQTLMLRRLADACDLLPAGTLSAWLDVSVSIDDHNMPQPDIFVSTGLPEDGPVPLDLVRLVVEIADSSLDHDLAAKQRLYARAGIPEYWVADTNRQVLHQMWQPAGDRYAEAEEASFGFDIAARTIDGLVVRLPEL